MPIPWIMRHAISPLKFTASAQARLITAIIPTAMEALRTRPNRSAIQLNRIAPASCPTYVAPISRPLCRKEICHSPLRTGNANASDSAPNASKKVALPITTRAFMCHRVNGTLSSRASNCPAEAALGREWNVPGIIAVEPARIVVAALHPGVGSRDHLNARRTRLAVRFITLKRRFNVVYFRQTARQHGGILDSGRRALRHVGRHRMAGIAQQRHTPIAPARQRVAIED